MKRWLETAAWLAALTVLSAMVLSEGRRRAALEVQIPLAPAELYHTLAHSQTTLQVVDAREDLSGGYEDAHIPGAVPMPGCDLARTPEAARQRIQRSVPTVVVSAGGDEGEVRQCLSLFTSARVLAGGMKAWDEQNLPEDTGSYTPPSARAGGGCL